MTETYDKLNHLYAWNGGECPIHPRTVISGIERGIHWDDVLAGELDWQSFRGAFRIIKLHVEPKVIWVNEYETHLSAKFMETTAIGSAATDAVRVAVRYVEKPQ